MAKLTSHLNQLANSRVTPTPPDTRPDAPFPPLPPKTPQNHHHPFTYLNLLILQLILHSLRIRILALILRILPPINTRPEDDILPHARRVGRRPGPVLGRLPKLDPGLALGNARVDDLAVGDVANAAGRLDFLVLVVVAVLDDGGGAVLVLDFLGGGKVGGGELVEVVVVGPVVPGWWWELVRTPGERAHKWWVWLWGVVRLT